MARVRIAGFAFALTSLVYIVALAQSAAAALDPPRTWNPWNKESPEPYGYDVASAPDLPLGHVDPADPPAVMPSPPPVDPRTAVLQVVTAVDRTAYSWFGMATVTADVRREGAPLTDCDSVIAVSAANPRVRARLADDGIPPDLTAGDGRYSGRYEIGAGEGEARPTGNYTLTATAYRGAESGAGTSPVFSLYSVRRWTGITTGGGQDITDDYTAFFVTPNGPGAGYHHEIRDLGLVRSVSVANAQIRIPILPSVNAITNLTVAGNGVSNAAVRGNVIEFDCNLTFGTVSRVTIRFDAPSDLAATRIDRYHTGDIALRDFRNGYLVWNRFIHTAILGSGYTTPHGPGCIVDLHVTDLENGDAHTVDCMERVAVHLDNAAFNDGSGTYPSNIKWGGDALSWYASGDLEELVFRFTSGGTYGLASKVLVNRRVEFAAESRLFQHRYVVRNVDTASHDFDFVWGREQWLYGSAPGSDRQVDDRGLLPNDGAAYGAEFGFTPEQVDGSWLAAYDLSSNYAIGVVAPGSEEAWMPTHTYFLCNAPLGNFTGEYPIVPAGACTHMENLFFERRFGVLAPGDSAAYTFDQWGGYGADRRELTEILWRDAVARSGEPLAIAYAPLGDEAPVTAPIDVLFNNAMDRGAVEAAFSIEPVVQGTFDWMEDDHRLRFRPDSPLEPYTIHHVRIARSATDQLGRPLATAADWYFETGAGAAGVGADAPFAGALRYRGASPNPLRAGTATDLALDLALAGRVRITVHDARGRIVATPADGTCPAGRNIVRWTGLDRYGERLPAGVYFVRLTGSGEERVGKIVIR